jgi:hypothetical protein
MTTQAQCCVPQCVQRRIAKGFCRRHYAQMRRHGEIREEQPEHSLSDTAKAMLRCSLQIQIAEAQRNYDLVVGLSGRLRWRQRIKKLQQQFEKLSENSPVFVSAEA